MLEQEIRNQSQLHFDIKNFQAPNQKILVHGTGVWNGRLLRGLGEYLRNHLEGGVLLRFTKQVQVLLNRVMVYRDHRGLLSN